MPELPEVETVRRGLEKALMGKTVESVSLRRKTLRLPIPPQLEKALKGRRIVSVGRRAKYLLMYFDDHTVLIAHLGMSGSFSVLAEKPPSFKAHDHVVFAFKEGGTLVYNDPRRFGLLALCDKISLKDHPFFAHLGPEPLEKAFSATYLQAALAKRSGPIKPVLMDQALVVGVGNIYACEALFLAKISPKMPAKQAAGHAPLLISSIQKVLKSAIKSGGSSLRDFIHVNGEMGYFSHHFNVYDKKGKPCPVCHAPIAAFKQAGRSTFYCPKCQK